MRQKRFLLFIKKKLYKYIGEPLVVEHLYHQIYKSINYNKLTLLLRLGIYEYEERKKNKSNVGNVNVKKKIIDSYNFIRFYMANI